MNLDKPLFEALCHLSTGTNHHAGETHNLGHLSWPKLFCSFHRVRLIVRVNPCHVPDAILNASYMLTHFILKTTLKCTFSYHHFHCHHHHHHYHLFLVDKSWGTVRPSAHSQGMEGQGFKLHWTGHQIWAINFLLFCLSVMWILFILFSAFVPNLARGGQSNTATHQQNSKVDESHPPCPSAVPGTPAPPFSFLFNYARMAEARPLQPRLPKISWWTEGFPPTWTPYSEVRKHYFPGLGKKKKYNTHHLMNTLCTYTHIYI